MKPTKLNIAALATFAFLSHSPCQAQFLFETNNGTITITRYMGGDDTVTIPDTMFGLPVTAIWGYAFMEEMSLTNVIIGTNLISIGRGVVYGCISLTDITVNRLNPVYSSADGVLFDKNQTTLILCPEGKAGSLTIANSVNTIAGGAVQGCTNLTSVTIPNSVTSIGEEAFGGCTGLTNVTIPNSVTNVGHDAFNYCTNVINVTIPNSVTSIGAYAFAYCYGLTSVTIPNSVINLGYEAFGYCSNLTSVTINCTGIGDDAFFQCQSLTALTIGNSVTSIGEGAFFGCTNLTSVTIPNSVTNIGYEAFAACTRLRAVYFQGDAPSVDSSVAHSSVFAYGSNPIIYYLPGATGWGPTFGGFGGRPTALWNPQAQTSDPSFGVRTNRFGFTITGTTNIPILIEACTNLAIPMWVSLQSCTLTNGSIYFTDPQWTNYPSRFYRIRSP